MDELRSDRDASAIDDRMAAQIEERRRQRAERRVAARAVTMERRRVCGYCFQRGDHRTAADCLRALERRGVS